MLAYLILAILVGFIAVDIIRSRPKSQPKVAKEETLKCDKLEPAVPAPEEPAKETIKCDKPKPAIPAPEEAPKETFVCSNCKRELNKKYLYKQGMCVDCIINSPNYTKPAPAVFAPKETLKYDRPKPAIPTPEETPKETFVCLNCKRELNKKYLYKRCLCVDCVTNPQKYGKPKPASSTPGDMTLLEQLEIERGLSYEERLWFRERETLKAYLNRDDFASYMRSVVRRQYSGSASDGYSFGFPEYSLGISDVIIILDEFCLSSEGQLLGIKPKYIETLKICLQSDERFSYYTALDFIYHHLLLETNNKLEMKLSDDAELYKIFKDSIPKHIDYLKTISYGEAELDHCTLYEFTGKIDKMFCSAFEQRKLPVPE